jgi:NTE family protein
MQNSIASEKLKTSKPDILIKTDIKNVRMLEFTKFPEIFKQAEKSKEQLKTALLKLLPINKK